MNNTIKIKLATLLVFMLVLPSCGGGGGGSGTNQTSDASSGDTGDETMIQPPSTGNDDNGNRNRTSSWYTCGPTTALSKIGNRADGFCGEINTNDPENINNLRGRGSGNSVFSTSDSWCQPGRLCNYRRISCTRRPSGDVVQVIYPRAYIRNDSSHASSFRFVCRAPAGRPETTYTGGITPRAPETGTGGNVTDDRTGTGGGTRCDMNTAWRGPVDDIQISSFCRAACVTVDAAGQSVAAGDSAASAQYERQASAHCDLMRRAHQRFRGPYSIQAACPICNGR